MTQPQQGGVPGIGPGIIALLVRCGPLTKKEIALYGKFSVLTVRHVLPRLHKKKLIHITEWEIVDGLWAPIYKFGEGDDAVKVPFGKEERNRRWREKSLAKKESIITSGPWAGLGA